MTSSKSAKQKIYAMGAGAIALTGILSYVGADSAGLARIIFSVVVFAFPAVYLLYKSNQSYGSNLDLVEQTAMVFVGGAGILGLFTFVAGIFRSEFIPALGAALIFGVPAILLIYVNTRRKTYVLNA